MFHLSKDPLRFDTVTPVTRAGPFGTVNVCPVVPLSEYVECSIDVIVYFVPYETAPVGKIPIVPLFPLDVDDDPDIVAVCVVPLVYFTVNVPVVGRFDPFTVKTIPFLSVVSVDDTDVTVAGIAGAGGVSM
ncbi:hypothetical protein BLNAU_19413 [Blattamonas nauphoetae]|uniref:Uncharacterized protein n=1 Tax=Blattamonas nauphoetae TaxID=2049346 RepID=A0ABQ9X1P6_9EUKA|nr:hypothetical protein BLNAU_19413 [Blattamonas nauphoetae]